jgi:hypothetical protein
LNVFADHKAPDIDYLRQPLADEARKLYVHGFDKNYMFLSACSIHLGDGDYETRDGGAFEANLPGIWQASIKEGRAEVAELCKLRACEDVEIAGRFWYYTPTLALAEWYGARIKVRRAHVWRETRKALDYFYKKVRAGVIQRAELAGPELIAARSLKDSYTHFIGWLARNSGENGQAFWRPDWRSMIVDEAYARELRNIVKVIDETGMVPVGIHRDCLLYLSNEADAARALPAPLTGADAMYKHAFTASGGELMKMIDAGLSVAKIANGLKTKWEGVQARGTKRRRAAAKAY